MNSKNPRHDLTVKPIEDGDITEVIALWQRCGLTRAWNDPAADIALARKEANATVNFLAFTPSPQLIPLQLRFIGEQTVHIAELASKAKHYVFKPQIGKIRQFFGRFFGKLPAGFHYDCWIVAAEVPSFVQFEGPLQLMGPIVRIELVSPRLTVKPEDKKIPAE